MPDLIGHLTLSFQAERSGVEKSQKRPMDRVGDRLNYPAGPMPFGPVRTFGPIPPMRQRFARLWAPPVHEATGGYAVRRAQGHAVIIQSEKEKIAQALSGPISINEM